MFSEIIHDFTAGFKCDIEKGITILFTHSYLRIRTLVQYICYTQNTTLMFRPDHICMNIYGNRLAKMSKSTNRLFFNNRQVLDNETDSRSLYINAY